MRTAEGKKLLKLCLSGLKDKNIDEKNYKAFFKNYTCYTQGALTFREVMASIKEPKGSLKVAMETYYAAFACRRIYKN